MAILHNDPSNESQRQSSTPEAASPDGGGSPSGPVAAQLEAAFTSAASTPGSGPAPVNPPKRKPGQRGPDKRPRAKSRPLFVDRMDESPSAPLFAEGEAALDHAGLSHGAPPVDDASLRAGVEGVVRLLEGGAVLWIGVEAKKATDNTTLIERVKEGARMRPEIREAFVNGGVGCWKKYFPNTPIGPELELLGAVGLWGAQIKGLIDELRALAKLRAEPVAA